MASAAAMENLKMAVRVGDLKSLSAGRLDEWSIELNEGFHPDNYAPLHWACHYRNPEVVQHFLDLGASPGVRSVQGWTPAHVCAIRGCAICLQILKDAGVDLSARDKRGYTCSHLAAIHGKCSVMQVFIKEGVDLQEVDRRKWGVVHHAAFHGRLAILQLLLKLSELSYNAADLEGNTPAHLAAAEGHLDCLRLLVYHRNDPAEVIGARNDKGSTPKDLAEQFHKEECADFLSLAESDVESFDYEETGEYKAHVAAKEGNLQLLSMLIKESHCSINDRDSQGSTPLHKAAGNGKRECLQWLIDHGADLYARNSKGETPRDVALRFGKLECASVLRSHGTYPPGGQEDEKREQEDDAEDDPSAESIERAKERVEGLQSQFMAAKARLRELGGELLEDNEIELIKNKHQKTVADLENKLQYERERRENLEADMDQLRKQLHHSTALLKAAQGKGQGDSSLESTPDHLTKLIHNKSTKKSKHKRNWISATPTSNRPISK